MAYALYYDAPGNPELYRLVGQEIGDRRPAGLLVQMVTANDVGLRHLDVWQTREQWEEFRDQHVRPAVAAVLERLGIAAPAGIPEEHVLDLIDLTVPPGR